MIDKNIVGSRIAILRKKLGYSQAIFAEKLSVTTQAVSKWETGLALPDIEVLLNISWITKTSLHTILEGEDFLEPNNGIDRGLLRISKHLACPQCQGALHLRLPLQKSSASFLCENGHSYDVVDGVLHFGSREIQGELWSLWLRNYEHYLKEQRHTGNPQYMQGDPHYREVMWQKIDQLRPQFILDIACGTGSGIKYIIERIHWPVTIIMTDLSHRILKWNRTYFAEEWKNPYVDIAFLACDCANLPLADNCMDLVYSNGGFESMQHKMMAGFSEGFRVLRHGAHAVYNMSTVEDHYSENTKKWMQLYTSLSDCYHPGIDKMDDIAQWLQKCERVGYSENEAVKIHGELTAPIDDVFPFENEILQWMAEYVVISTKTPSIV